MNRAEKRRQKKLAEKTARNAKPEKATYRSPEQQTIAIQESLTLALQHHNAGDYLQAEGIYQQVLQADPNQPDALHLLGVIAHQMGKIDSAINLITQALAIKPDFPEAHNNLGNAFKQQGKLDEAVASYREALANKHDYADAHNNLGSALQNLGMLDEAIASYHKAVAIKPDYPEAHYNLGIALKDQGKLDEAIACYGKALTIKPDYTLAHNNLGYALNELGKPDEAVQSYQKALAIEPGFAGAHNNLGIALKSLGRPDEAVASFQKALTIEPDYAEALKNLGLQLTTLGRFTEAKAVLDQGFRITHGGPWWNAATFADGDRPGAVPAPKAMYTSAFKLRDTIDQLEYLIAKSRIDPSFQHMVDRYQSVLTEIQQRQDHEAVNQLTASQLELLGSFYDRVIHYTEAPRIATGTVNESLDFKHLEDRYISSPVSVTVFDDFLTPEALRALHNFCLESTIFFAHGSNHFVGSRSTSGFNCDLLYQIAEEVKERFPRVLGDHQLADMWVYRYRNQSVGVAAHTDEAAVTFNFWITPEEANLTPDRGGLVVFTKEQPYDWDMQYYNINKFVPSVSQEIADFLADADCVTIPYQENRAVLFHSNLFHKSDQINFRDGYENRRINVTFVFGARS